MNTEFSEADKIIIKHALFILEMHHKNKDMSFTQADETKNYLRLSIGGEDREIFGVLFLNRQNQLISFEKLFVGTTDHVSVYCKEIVKTFIKHNASTVILTHNHPSGDVSPSAADFAVTRKIIEALKFFDGEVLDHIIVSKTDAYSFAEYGRI
ncbi:hypothetical protein ABVL22_004289 [Salmonella enterica]